MASFGDKILIWDALLRDRSLLGGKPEHVISGCWGGVG